MKILLTCEHAGNEIPEKFKGLFMKAPKDLNSHRGYDLGALDLFKHLEELSDYSYFHPVSRLLIEINRSIGHPFLFSEYTRSLDLKKKKELIKRYYDPYRKEVEADIQRLKKKNQMVLHLSIHSFTPVLNEEERNADLGILYDPARVEEKKFSKDLKNFIKEKAPQLKVRYNYPYLGKADGFTTYLRRKFPNNYLGIELEVNQKFSSLNEMHPVIKENIYLALKNYRKEQKM